MVDQKNIAYVSNDRGDVNINNNPTKQAAHGFRFPSIRCQGNGSNIPPGAAPANKSGRFDMKLGAHQAAMYMMCCSPVMNGVLVAAVEAFNSASVLTLPGPEGEILNLLQQRAYAHFLYKIFARSLVLDPRICAALMLLYQLAYSGESPHAVPELRCCEEAPIFGVAKEFVDHIQVLKSPFFEELKSTPREDAVGLVLLAQEKENNAAKQRIVDAQTAEDQRADDEDIRRQEIVASARESRRRQEDANEKYKQERRAALAATEALRKAEHNAKMDYVRAAIRGQGCAL